MALAAGMLELGRRALPEEFRYEAYGVALLGALRVCYFNLLQLKGDDSWEARLIPLGAAALAYGFGARARGRVLDVASVAGTGFLLTGLWAVLPPWAVGPAWAAVAVALVVAAGRFERHDLEWQSYMVAAMAFARCWASDFYLGGSYAGIAVPVLAGGMVIACLYGAQLLNGLGTWQRLYFSLLATGLLTVLLGYQVSGSMLTVACGIEGIALLGGGFPLRDRVLRFSGLALLTACILKLFVYDLRKLDTPERILSFIVLGFMLVVVSWIYTRFRERMRRYL
jgi:uncharacterized membrane protein